MSNTLARSGENATETRRGRAGHERDGLPRPPFLLETRTRRGRRCRLGGAPSFVVLMRSPSLPLRLPLRPLRRLNLPLRGLNLALRGLRTLLAAGATAGGIAGLAASASGCGGAGTGDSLHVAATATGTATGAKAAAPLQAAVAVAGGYQAWSGPRSQLKCSLRVEPAPPSCSGAARCPVIRSEAALCNVAVKELSLAGGTAVLELTGDKGVQELAYWPAGDAVHVVSSAGAEARPTLNEDGALFVVRVEQGRLVDYRLDGQTLMRRVWDAMPGENNHLMMAAWSGERLVARLSKGYSSRSREIVAARSGVFSARDVDAPEGNWPYAVVPTFGGGGRAYAVLYGSGGVGIAEDQRVWYVPRAVSRTAAERDLLAPATQMNQPVFSFRSFDGGDPSGAHVLVPKGPFGGAGSVPVIDVHLLSGRLLRTSDCVPGAVKKPRPCARVESDSQGAALARTDDGRVWLAFVVTRREHRAIGEVVCPPQPRCQPNEPCRPVPCVLNERDVHDSVRHELSVVRIAADGAGAELGFRYEMTDIADAYFVQMVDMTAVGRDLHFVVKAGENRVRRVQLDTTAMSPVPLGQSEVTVTPIQLTPEPG